MTISFDGERWVSKDADAGLADATIDTTPEILLKFLSTKATNREPLLGELTFTGNTKAIEVFRETFVRHTRRGRWPIAGHLE